MENVSNLKCSIVEVVGRDDNRVVVVVTNFDMVVGLLVAKEASYMFHQCPHFYIWLVTQEAMGSFLSYDHPHRCDIRRCCSRGIPFGDA